VRARKLLEQVRQAVRLRHYSPRTEESYVGWIRRYLRFHALRHPRELGAAAVTRILVSLAEVGRLSTSSQAQALSALLFLYKEVLHRPLESLVPIPRAKQAVRLPVVLDRDEVRLLLARLVGPPRIAVLLMYGSGLRLLEVLHLRVKDVDFGMGEIVVRRAKGGKDRVTMLPGAAVPELKAHLERARRVHQRDLAEGGGLVSLPGAYERK
jgi:integrase